MRKLPCRRTAVILFNPSSSSSCRGASTDISMTLSRHFSLSFIDSGRSSGLHPVSSHSCCMYVRAGRPAFARPYVGVHRSTSFMSLSLLLQQCPACLVRLTWIVFVMGGGWSYSWCFSGVLPPGLVQYCWDIISEEYLFQSKWSSNSLATISQSSALATVPWGFSPLVVKCLIIIITTFLTFYRNHLFKSCLPMVQKTGVQSEVESYQRLKIW